MIRYVAVEATLESFVVCSRCGDVVLDAAWAKRKHDQGHEQADAALSRAEEALDAAER